MKGLVSILRDLMTASFLTFLLGAAAGGGAIYFAFFIIRAWLENRPGTRKGRSAARTRSAGGSLDSHIATQWTEGRLRLDALLALMRQLGVSLEQEVEKLRQLDSSLPLYEREALKQVDPTLRRFTFDKHLRDECRVLVPLLQFCAQDLAESQGIDMTQKLRALAEIRAAIELGGGG